MNTITSTDTPPRIGIIHTRDLEDVTHKKPVICEKFKNKHTHTIEPR